MRRPAYTEAIVKVLQIVWHPRAAQQGDTFSNGDYLSALRAPEGSQGRELVVEWPLASRRQRLDANYTFEQLPLTGLQLNASTSSEIDAQLFPLIVALYSRYEGVKGSDAFVQVLQK